MESDTSTKIRPVNHSLSHRVEFKHECFRSISNMHRQGAILNGPRSFEQDNTLKWREGIFEQGACNVHS